MIIGGNMKYELDNTTYDVIIIKKNNKNSYIRITDDMNILVTTNYFATKKGIKKMLDQNTNSLRKMLNRQQRINKKKERFFYLGKYYDIIEVPIIKDIKIENNVIYIPSEKKLERWLKEELIRIYSERLEYNYNRFEEIDKCPSLKIRTMKTRWGVYNRIKHTITLNSHLIEYDIDKIDYVIIHELSHVIHFNHSQAFWKLVGKYCPNYKEMRKALKE